MLHLSKLLLLIIGFSTTLTSANLITNGDFETSLSGWIINPGPGANGTVVAGTATNPVWSGTTLSNTFALLGGGTNDDLSRIAQDFDITGLDSIRITFDWAFTYTNQPSQNDTFLSILRNLDLPPAAGISVQELLSTGTQPGGDTIFGTYTGIFDVSAFGDDARIIFELNEGGASNSGNSRAGVDNVSITAVPEPGIIYLLGAGLAGIGVARRVMHQQ